MSAVVRLVVVDADDLPVELQRRANAVMRDDAHRDLYAARQALHAAERAVIEAQERWLAVTCGEHRTGPGGRRTGAWCTQARLHDGQHANEFGESW